MSVHRRRTSLALPVADQISPGRNPWVPAWSGANAAEVLAHPFAGWPDIGTIALLDRTTLLVASHAVETTGGQVPGIWELNANTLAVEQQITTDEAFWMAVEFDSGNITYADLKTTTLKRRARNGTLLNTWTLPANICHIIYPVDADTGAQLTDRVLLVLADSSVGRLDFDSGDFTAFSLGSGNFSGLISIAGGDISRPSASGLILGMHDGILFMNADSNAVDSKIFMAEPAVSRIRPGYASTGRFMAASSFDGGSRRNPTWPLSWIVGFDNNRVSRLGGANGYPRLVLPLASNNVVPHYDDPQLLYMAWWNGVYLVNLRDYQPTVYPIHLSMIDPSSNPPATLAAGEALSIGPLHGAPYWNRVQFKVWADTALTLRVRTPRVTSQSLPLGATRVGGPITEAMLKTQWQDLSTANKDIVLPVTESLDTAIGMNLLSLTGSYPTFMVELVNTGETSASVNACEVYCLPT